MRFYSLLPFLLPLLLWLTPHESPPATTSDTLNCGSESCWTPSLRKLQDSLDQAFSDYQSRDIRPGSGADFKSAPPPYTLPIVFHIIHDNGAENISDARIQTSLDQLNESFANIGYYDQGEGVNTQIQFCLAQRDPDNNGTTGITRHVSPLTEVNSSTDAAMKNLARWEPREYINVYVVREICLSSCNVAGYAYYPGAHGSNVDGIVVEARWLGDTEARNSVMTHEMGHYLGLYHTFNGGCSNDDCTLDGDRVCDTPPDQSTTAVPCSGSANSCTTDTNSGFATDQDDMFNNYMDYGYWSCYNALTQGQTDRMHFFIEGIRSSLLTSPGCLDPCPSPVTASFISSDLGPVEIGTTINFTNTSTNATSYEWYVNGVLVSTTTDHAQLFDNEGFYTVELVALGTPPLCFPARQRVFIQVVCSLTANFNIDNPTPQPGIPVNFTATDGSGDLYQWRVNGIVAGSTPNLNYVFPTPGFYQVCLETSRDSCFRDQCRSYLVNGNTVDDPCSGPTYVSLLGADQDQAYRSAGIAIAQDGGLFQLGYTPNTIILAKQLVNGNLLWSRQILIPQQGSPIPYAMRVLADGDLLITGGTTTPNSGSVGSGFVLRYDADNDLIVWFRVFESTGNIRNAIPIPIPLPAEEFVLLADLHPNSSNNASNEAWVFDINAATGNSTGNWTYQSDQVGPNTFLDGVYLNNALYTTGRFAYNPAASSFRSCLARFTTPSVPDFIHMYPVNQNANARLYGVAIAEYNGMIYVVSHGDPDGQSLGIGVNGYLSCFTAQGELQWSREVTTPLANTFRLYEIAIENDEIYLVGRYENLTAQLVVLKTSLTGELIWNRSYTMPAGSIDVPFGAGDQKLIITNDGLLIPATLTTNNATNGNDPNGMLLIRTDTLGLIADDCLTVTDPQVRLELIEGSVNNFIPQATNRSPQFFDAFSEILPSAVPLLNACLTACPDTVIIDANCTEAPCNGAQFAQVIDDIEGRDLKGSVILPLAGTDDYILGGTVGTNILLNRISNQGISYWEREIPTTGDEAQLFVLNMLHEDADGMLVGVGTVFNNPDIQYGFIFRYDQVNDQLLYFNQLETESEIVSVTEVDANTYMLMGAELNGMDPLFETLLFMQVDKTNGLPAAGAAAGRLDFGGREQFSDVKLFNNKLYTTGIYTLPNAGADGSRAAFSRFDLDGNEEFSYTGHQGTGAQSRLFGFDLEIIGQTVYLLQWGSIDVVSGDFGTQSILSAFTLDGNFLWTKVYDIPNYSGESGVELEPLNDGLLVYGYALTGQRDIYLYHLDLAGEPRWSYGYNMPGNALLYWRANQQLQTGADHIFLTATISYPGSNQASSILLLRTDIEGQMENACIAPYPIGLQVSEFNTPWPSQDLEELPFDVQLDSPQSFLFPGILERQTACLTFCCEVCDNGIDDDQNGLTDCEDPALANDCCCLPDPQIDLGPDTAYCANTGFSLVLSASNTQAFEAYLWQNGSTNDQITVDSAGIYWVEVRDTCGRTAIDSIFVRTRTDNGPLDLGPDLTVCDEAVTFLDVGPGWRTYLWSDFSIESSTTFYGSGTYWLEVTDSCGLVQRDSITITEDPVTVLDLQDEIVFCPGDSLQVMVNGYANYRWFPRNAFACDTCNNVWIYAPSIGDTTYYTLLVSNAAGNCLSTDSIRVRTETLEGDFIDASICTGQQYQFGDTLINTAGTYFRNSLCGGIDTLDLAILTPPPPQFSTLEICNGDSVLVQGFFRFNSGIFRDTIPANNGCDSIVTVELIVQEPAISFDTINLCAGDSIQVFGNWITAAGDFTQSFPLANAPCDSVANISVRFTPIPTLSLLINSECGDTLATVNGQVSSGTPPYQYRWSDPSLSGPFQALPTGNYTLEVTDEFGCVTQTGFTVEIDAPVEFEIVIGNPSCRNGTDGYLQVLPSNTNTVISVNGEPFVATDSIANLSAGTYDLTFIDSLGCITSGVYRLSEPAGFAFVLPADTILRIGDSLSIRPQTIGLDENLATYNWYPPNGLNCDTCRQVVARPGSSITYYLEITDAGGCPELDSLKIFIDDRERIYVPNAFSPNGDGVNDLFYPFAGPEVAEIELMQIHERWGGMVFQATTIPPNDPGYGWDGRLNGRLMGPGVYVYHLRIRLFNGERLDLAGEVVLLR